MRRKLISVIEDCMVRVLADSGKPLTLEEIVLRIQKMNPMVLSGTSPAKSLYSVIYRREKTRADDGEPGLFKRKVLFRVGLYSLRKQQGRRKN